MGAPVVTPLTRYILLNQPVLASSLFTATDPDGDPITQFRFTDLGTGATSGFFRLNGVPRPQGSTTTVTDASLANLTFVAGSLIGNESIRIEVFANGQWSSAALSSVFFVRENTTPPVVVTSNPTVLQDEAISLSTFISASDPDGWPILKFYLRDQLTGSNSGFLRLNGTALTQGAWQTVQASSFSGLEYVAVNHAEKERIEVFAWDGAAWSEYKFALPNILRNINAPTAFFGEINVPAGESSSISNGLGWNDPDGNTIKRFQFIDKTVSSSSGNLELNGTILAPNVWHFVDAQNLASMRFFGASTSTQDIINYRVYDGRYWSAPAELRVNSVPGIVKPRVAPRFVHQTSLWNQQVAPLINKLDVGPAFTQYEFIDLSLGSLTGNLRLGQTDLQSGVIHQISAAQLNQLVFRTGRPETRSIDEVLFRANNGTYWSDWTRIAVHTEPQYRHALKDLDNPFNLQSMDANDWNDWLLQVAAPPNRLTYSFRDQWDGNSFDGSTEDNFSKFSIAQRAMAREAFRQVSEFTNLVFEEVLDNDTNVFFQAGGIIRMSNYANPDGEAAAYAQFPGPGALAGDIKMNVAFTSTVQTAPGTPTFETFIHELGHSLGLKHPHEGIPQLTAAVDDPLFTVMSYTPNTTAPGVNMHSLYDVISLQDLYGANMNTRTGDTLYSISGYFGGNANWMGTIWDAGGTDTLSAVGAQLGCILDLRQGARSSIGTRFNPFTSQLELLRDHISIAFNCDIENATGSANDDIITGNYLSNVLIGNAGNDTIWSGAGNDFMHGNAGNDTFIYRLGDGNDVIDEQQGAGRDRINIGSHPRLDNFTADLSFRKLGTDLLIEFAIDNGPIDATLRIVNQDFGMWRIETIQFNGVDVDLSSISSQATAASKRFSLTSNSSVFGLLAIPA